MAYPRFHGGGRRSPGRSWQRLLIIGTVLSIVFSTHAILPAVDVAAAPLTATADLALRAGPGPDYEVVATIPGGATVDVTGEAENGYLPVTWDGLAGYAAAEFLATGDATVADTGESEASAAEVTTGPTGVRYVTNGDLNLRSGPDTSYPTLQVLPDGAAVELTGQVSSEFSEITYNETTGWAMTEYLGTDVPAEGPAPVTEIVTPTTPEVTEAETPVATEPSDAIDPETPVATEPAESQGPAVQALEIGDTPIGTATVATGGLSLNMRSGPGTSFGVLRSIPSGATVDVMGAAESGFLPVRYQGTSGWASSSYLRTSTTPATPTTTPVTPTPTTPGGIGDTPVGTANVITDGLSLNMRSGPGTTYGVVRSIPSGATVDVMGAAQSGFLPVRYQGTKGWASATWLRTGGSPATPTPTATPVTATPTATPVTPTATPVTPTPTATPGGGIGDTPVGSATVITDGLSLNMRSGPGTSFGVVRAIPSGATVDVMGSPQNGFLPVRYQGTKGWSSASWLRVGATTPTPTATSTPVTPTPTSTPVTPTPTVTPTTTPTGTPGGGPVGTATVITDGLSLNMRSGPGATFGVIRSIPSGATVDVMGAAQNGFLPVRYQGTSGWASATWLQAGSGATPTPTVTPTATPVTPTPTTTPVDPNNPPIGNAAIGKATINASVSLRRGPATSYGHIQTLNNGWKVEIMGDPVNGWTPVRYNAAKGWVPSGNLTPGWGWTIVDQMITPSRSIPMYSTPGGPNRVVQVPPGTLVDITGTAQGTWVPARWAGYSGWVDSALMYQPEDFDDPGPRNDQEAQMIAFIYQAADKWGQSRADMLRVARCESGLNPNVVNPASGTSGLFQFMPSTFAFTPNGKAGENIFDPWSNADAAGWMWANGMRHHWACQ